jgi:hypothetical protein
MKIIPNMMERNIILPKVLNWGEVPNQIILTAKPPKIFPRRIVIASFQAHLFLFKRKKLAFKKEVPIEEETTSNTI